MERTLEPLTGLFAVVDDVFEEPDAFAPNRIHASLGRIYREWLDAREALDPDFDRARYRQAMKTERTPPTSAGGVPGGGVAPRGPHSSNPPPPIAGG